MLQPGNVAILHWHTLYNFTNNIFLHILTSTHTRSLPPNYPCVPPVFEIEANQSGSFSYRDADELFDLLMVESINQVGGMMVFDLVTIAQDYMPGGNTNHVSLIPIPPPFTTASSPDRLGLSLI